MIYIALLKGKNESKNNYRKQKTKNLHISNGLIKQKNIYMKTHMHFQRDREREREYGYKIMMKRNIRCKYNIYYL